jgi:spermidine synthase
MTNQTHRPRCLLLMLSLLVAATTTALISEPVSAKIIHRERSLYSTILLDQRGSVICLQFSIRQDPRNQSCKDLKDPQKLIFGYAKMMMMSLLLQPDPKRILIAGLGGGTLPTMLNELYPDADIDVIEIDPAVTTVAETYFDFRENEHVKVIVQDARVFTKRAVMRGDKYDLIMLDAFNGDYIPEHLMTKEYLEETRDLLADNGVLAANTFSISRLYDHESATYAAVFGEFFNVTQRDSANRIIITTGKPLPDIKSLQTVARMLTPRLKPYSLDINTYRSAFSVEVDWDPDARVLTDQYAPANLLREE